MRISGLGDTTTDLNVPACGTVNPCTWWDEVWVRNACLSYLRCADPSNPLVVGMDQGFVAGVTDLIGQEVASGVQGAGTGVARALNVPGWVILGGVALGGLILIKTLAPRR